MDHRERTRAEARAHNAMMIELDRLEQDMRDARLRRALIPDDWHRMEETAPVRQRRKKVTVALDEDVARWFHGLGEGYHRRINAVLRTYMLALVSKEVLVEGDRDRHGDAVWGVKARKGKG